MKKVLFLSFYYEPDLCAGSFRNTSLAKELGSLLKGKVEIDVFTTLPNRYKTYQKNAPIYEKIENLNIHRIKISKHNNGFLDQIKSFSTFFFEVTKMTKSEHYDLVYASSSRLFTAYLGYRIANKKNIPFYIDIRDIFLDTMKDLLGHNPLKLLILPFLKYIENITFSKANHINLISGGFSEYFSSYKRAQLTFFTNGIDNEFLNLIEPPQNKKTRMVILYAGNIGEGQGLHKFVPDLAKNFEMQYDFVIIGDGGAKQKLINRILETKCSNIYIKDPISRNSLIKEYEGADFLLLHLNDLNAFKKVLPSKIFEFGATDKPIIAGVAGYSAKFLLEHVSNLILVEPCDYIECIRKLKKYNYKRFKRIEFIEKFNRTNINRQMATSIASYLPVQ